MNIVQFNFHLHAWFAAILSLDTGIERVFHPHVYSYAVLNINCTSWGKRKCSPALPTIGYCWLKHFFPTATIKMKPLRAKIGTKFTRQWPWAIFIAPMLAGPSKWLKQIIQIKHNMVKNPIWSEVNQLAIYKCSRIWTGDYREQIQLAVRAGLGASRLHVQCSNHSATLPLTYNNKFFLTTMDPNLNFTNVTFKGLCWCNLNKISTSSWIWSILSNRP